MFVVTSANLTRSALAFVKYSGLIERSFQVYDANFLSVSNVIKLLTT